MPPPAPNDPAFEARVRELYDAARRECPKVEVSLPTFAAHLSSRARSLRDLEALETEDLFVACGCEQGDAAAMRVLEHQHLNRVGEFIRTVDPAPAFADEVRQLVREKLLVATGGKRPKIAEYGGMGPLGAWVRVVSLRTARNLKRTERPQRSGDERALLERAAASTPELEYFRERYRDQVNEALRTSLSALDAKEKNLLVLYYVEDLSSAAIGKMFQVHGATIRRWVEQARQTLLVQTRQRLARALDLDESGLDSLLAFVASDLHLSMTRLLRPNTPSTPGSGQV